MQIDFAPLVHAIITGLRGNLTPDELLDTKGAATLLLVSEDTTLRWAANGVIPGRKLDGRWRFRKSALLDHVTDHTRTAPEEAQ